jgi:hypothetical protein
MFSLETKPCNLDLLIANLVTDRAPMLTGLAFANTLLYSLCNHFADAIANDWIIEYWIEFVRRKGLLRLRNRMTARTIAVRFLG